MVWTDGLIGVGLFGRVDFVVTLTNLFFEDFFRNLQNSARLLEIPADLREDAKHVFAPDFIELLDRGIAHDFGLKMQ